MDVWNSASETARIERLKAAHQHLYHYTSLRGLEGICASNCLWMTHYKHLNDHTEIDLMRPILARIVESRFKRIIAHRMKQDGIFKKRVREWGGSHYVCHSEARKVTDILYKVTFQKNEGRTEFSTPFILSFCSHDSDSSYVRANGLLSMWRSYGDVGSFAIVLETAQLATLMAEETHRRAYSVGTFDEVIYSDLPTSEIEKRHGELFDQIDYLVQGWLDNGETPDDLATRLFPPLFRAASLFKHQGFYEEREVRMAFSPLAKGYLKQPGLEEKLDLGSKTYVPIKTRWGHNQAVPYIAFNEGGSEKLPIRKIIVGPQPNAKEVVRQVRRFAPRVPIVISETPFRLLRPSLVQQDQRAHVSSDSAAA